MDHSVTFARHFARLVWLLLHEPANIDEQKATLRALVTISKDGAVSIVLEGDDLTADGTVVPAALAGVGDAASQMALHGLAAILVDTGAAPADLLGAARILAGGPALGDGGAAAEAKRQALGARTVRFTQRPREAPPAANAPSSPAAMPDLEFGEMVDDPIAAAATRATRVTPRMTTSVPAATEPRGDGGGLFEQFAAARVPTDSVEQLLAQLDTSQDPGVLTRVLDDLVVLTEHAARDGRAPVVSEVMHRIGQREGAVEEFEAKRAFVMALRRLAKPLLLRAVAMQLPHRAERRDELVAVLARAGEDGADALIEQIASVAGATDRRVYFDALLQLQAGIPTLLHMLGDARWFVARNAADLLGEMQAREAEQPLTALLQHGDDRVRRSATGALMRLGTPRATQAIQDALKDPAPQMRMEAAAALAARRDARTAATLIRALDAEKDDEVQAAFMLALGKLGTPDAVQRLTRTAEPERGLFRKKTTAARVAAVQGLAEARTREAQDALKALSDDRDEDVRAAAVYALGRIARQSGSLSAP